LPLFDDLLVAKPTAAVAAEVNDLVIQPGGGPVYTTNSPGQP